jgi:hypothetical protein
VASGQPSDREEDSHAYWQVIAVHARGRRAGHPSGALRGQYPAATGEGWGTAVEVPGIATLNVGGSAGMSSMSCPSAGNCAAGGVSRP